MASNVTKCSTFAEPETSAPIQTIATGSRWRSLLATLAVVLLVLPLVTGCGSRRPPAEQANPVAAGFQRNTFERLDWAVETSIRRMEIPGAVLCIARNDAVIYHKAFGVRDPFASPPLPMERTTRFDVASLTKPVAIAAAGALAQCEGNVSLSTELRGYTLDEHLRHLTDMPVYANWREIEAFREGGAVSPAEAIEALMDHHEEHGPPLPREGGYSNIGYILVAERLERMIGGSLEDYLRERFWQPLGMNRTTFLPPTDNVARTQSDVPAGRPFDPLADYILRTGDGGVPGHSGLFSTARDLTRFAQSLMIPGADRYSRQECVSRYLLSEFRPAESASSDGVRASVEPGRTPAFRVDTLSRGGSALYHTGYTGTLMWIDPPTRTSVVLLTNGTASGDAEAWQELRREVLDIIREDLPSAP